MTPENHHRAYYPALDVLRGIAISLVVIYHNFGFLSFFKFGWLGVDLFFVLSGFLITDLLLRTRENRFFFRNFYIRRVLRIFPLYYLTLILFYLLAPYLFSQKDPGSTYSYYNQHKIWFWSYLQNWLFVKNGKAPMPYLSHFWSLAVEEQFYIFWPMLMFFIKNLKKLRLVILILIGVALCLRWYTYILSPGDIEKYYCSTITRMDSLLVGCFLSIWMKEGKMIPKKFIHTVFGICSVFILLGATYFKNLNEDNALFASVGYTFFAMAFACVLYLFITSNSQMLQWLKRIAPLNMIGRISYGIYVYHLPIYLVLSTKLYSVFIANFNLSSDNTLHFISVLSVLITLIVSLLSFNFIERPILSLKKHFP